MFNSLNDNVADIADQVGRTPQVWNPAIFDMLRTLSETVIIPIAGIILTFILCYELIHMVIERNNMSDFPTFEIYKWVFKAFVAVIILTNTFDIVMAVFDLAQHVVSSSSGVISGNLDTELALYNLADQLEELGTGALIGLFIESTILRLAIHVMSIIVFIVIFGRMIEIYILVSIAPIPFSTIINRDWGTIGNNFLKSLFALAFQGFLIMVCVAIYAALAVPNFDDIQSSAWMTAGYTLLLCFMLFKTGSISKSIFGAN